MWVNKHFVYKGLFAIMSCHEFNFIFSNPTNAFAISSTSNPPKTIDTLDILEI